jgi:uncharacterized protein YecE (DUF72 family)
MLDFYCRRLDTVEINNSFYGLPSEGTLKTWRTATSSGFLFSAKASRYITHMKKLKDPDRTLPNFFDRMEGLGPRLGPVLFQLPPHWGLNLERLEAFLDALPPGHRYTVEFRNPGWFEDSVFELLSSRRVAFCIYQLAGFLSPKEVTTDLVYVRLHGPGRRAYEGSYDARTLAGWAGAFHTWADQGRDVYCYFDNDQAGYAALNAIRLRSMTG